MNAIIFSAGKGTRLRPLTDVKPKALVEIENFTLLEIAIRKLTKYGIKRIIINVHHFANQIIDFIKNNNFGEVEIFISDETQLLLDTGGGLVKAKNLFVKNMPIIAYNVDIICNINLHKLIDFHNNNKNLVSMFVQNRTASRFLLFDNENLLCGWQNPITGDEKWSTIPKESSKLGYNGIQVIDYEIFKHIKQQGVFSIIPIYIDLAANHKICGWINNEVTWFDIGTPEKLNHTINYLNECNDIEKSEFLGA